MGFKQ